MEWEVYSAKQPEARAITTNTIQNVYIQYKTVLGELPNNILKDAVDQ
ncbi:unnamed protein product [Schistosoma margrebowiei]|uniref:Uncharacterized protein n=1 Tax=Schistosoma margrebowiei TaxID=48269 RepID=A0A3P8BFP8_9TREM|nr:unnamed protein product [Schistosoma margrebowiei]